MFGQFPRYTCIRKQEIHSRKNRAVSAEALLQQLLLLLLVTLPFPSFTTNTTWKARKLFNNNRDAHENSHHFTMDLGYHVSEVPPSDGPLQIRTWSSGTFFTMKTTMSQWTSGPAGTYGASCPSTGMRKRSASTLPSGSSGIPLLWKDTRVYDFTFFVTR